jgi:peptidoglycan hydrolase-like protein with peptidoglycan-binding domain
VASPIDIAGKIFEIFSSLDSKQKCLIEVSNDTGLTLKRLADDHSSGGFATLPEDEIPAGGKDVFISHDTGILRGAVGEVTYGLFPDGAQAPEGRWTIRWSIPEVGDPSASQQGDGLDPATFVGRARIGDGDETEAKFELEGPGGGGTKRQPVDPGLKSTVLIEVRNSTDQVLTLVDQGHDHGGFVTLPATQIQPGGQDSFASFETDRAAPGSQGFLSYGVGDTGAEWTIGWNNPENADNTSTSVLSGNGSEQFTALDQIGAGEENVPAVFILSRGSGRRTPARGTRNSVEVTILNQSSQPLSFLDKGSFTGEFVTEPPAEIPAGESAGFSCAESADEEQTGCQGFVRYHAGDPGACLWTMLWGNPEQGENTASSSLDGAESDQFSADAQIAPEKETAVAVFTLTGGQIRSEPEFAPPVERDEPTLRLGDQSVDGWVEYLQQLLNAEGLGPLPEDGNFDNAVRAAVIRFQTERRDQAGGRLMVDGVVGHQTWAALREEAPRPPSTDGRKPHSYVEQGAEARFITEDSAVQYNPDVDELVLVAVSTGDQVIQPNQFDATARITFPDGQSHTFLVPVSNSGQPAGPGDVCLLEGTIAAALGRPLDPGSYQFEAYLPDELGGDQTQETLTIR